MKVQLLNSVAGAAFSGAVLALTSVLPAAAAAAPASTFQATLLAPSFSNIKAKNAPVKECAGIGAEAGKDGWKLSRPIVDNNAYHQVAFQTPTTIHYLVVTPTEVVAADLIKTSALLAKMAVPGYDPKNTSADIAAATKPAPKDVSGSLTADGIILHTPAGWTLLTAQIQRVALLEPTDVVVPLIELKAVCLPSATSPGTGKPGTGKPGTGKPGTGKPGTGKPGTSNPGTGKPGTAKPGTDKPGTSNPGTDEPGATEPGADNPAPVDPTTAAPAPTDGGDDGSDDNGSDPTAAIDPAQDGGPLPLTGTNVVMIAGGGATLVAAGIAFVVITLRRRRPTPTFKA